MLKYVLSGTIMAIACSTAFAKDEAGTGGPPMPAELKQLDYFAGTWNCTGKAPPSLMGPEHASAATVHSGRAVGDRWFHTTYDEKKTAVNPMPYHAGVYWGYDTGKKQFIQRCVDSFGGYCEQSSAGWKGDTLTFEGTGNGDGKQFGVRDVFVKKSAGELTHTGQMQGDDKNWTTTDEETCHKAK